MNEGNLFFLLRAWLWLRRQARPTDVQWNLAMAAVVGVVGAGLGLLFKEATLVLQQMLTGVAGGGLAAFAQLPPWKRVIVPTAGGLLAGLTLMLGQKLIRQKPTEYMEAITLGDGRLPVKSSLYRSLAAMLSIASGTAIGKEGPLVQLSALAASILGQMRKLPPARRRLLVACGAAAGVAAAYNAPIAAALFVSEITVGSLAMESLGPLIFASVGSIVTIHVFSDASPLYRLEHFALPHWPELACFCMVGIACGVMAALFLAMLDQFKKWFRKIVVPLALKLALGGLIVGLIALAHPEVTGNGYDALKSILNKETVLRPGELLWQAVLLTLLARMVATSSAFGSGAVGGVFTPTLVVGACTGSLCWQAFAVVFPDLRIDQAGFATVGMGAVLAAATQAPFMSILMIFEMTLSYEIMIPLMLASVIGYYTFRGFRMHSLYHHGPPDVYDIFNRPLETLTVADIMQTEPHTIGPHAGFGEVARQFLSGGFDRQYVVGPGRKLLGVVRLEDLSEHLHSRSLAAAFIAGDIAHENPPALDMRTPLPEALVLFTHEHEHELPVVRAGTGELAGTLTRNDLLLTLAEAGKRIEPRR
jgi:chloride channel protein, CIC family